MMVREVTGSLLNGGCSCTVGRGFCGDSASRCPGGCWLKGLWLGGGSCGDGGRG